MSLRAFGRDVTSQLQLEHVTWAGEVTVPVAVDCLVDVACISCTFDNCTAPETGILRASQAANVWIHNSTFNNNRDGKVRQRDGRVVGWFVRPGRGRGVCTVPMRPLPCQVPHDLTSAHSFPLILPLPAHRLLTRMIA